MHDAWQNGDKKKTMEIQDLLMPLHSALFCETSPGPIKYAAKLLGKCTEDVRLPLCEIEDRSKKTVEAAMVKTGLIN